MPGMHATVYDGIAVGCGMFHFVEMELRSATLEQFVYHEDSLDSVLHVPATESAVEEFTCQSRDESMK